MEELAFSLDCSTQEAYQHEVIDLLQVSSEHLNRRRFKNHPLSLRFGFLLASHSRPALEVAREFLPLPSYQTICEYYRDDARAVEAGVSKLEKIGDQIQLIMTNSGLPSGSMVSVAVDATAMNPSKATLPATQSENIFVLYLQPLDRRYGCWPLHVMNHPSGRATEEVTTAIDVTCKALADHGLVVKYICADGDTGHNQSHKTFFSEWYPLFLDGGLQAALSYVLGRDKFPVGDCLHLWKTFCNKLKNHLVVLSPDCLETCCSVDDLESLLKLGAPLSDKSSVGRMRDSYALKLFCLSNCVKCLAADQINEFMFLLPWALQEEVVRSPNLSREDRLMKAVLAFKLLLHYFDLSSLPHAEGVTQRFLAEETIAVTFAEDANWPRILNSALALVAFTLEADEHWSFSRMGTHCLENFFGLVRRSSLGDDRSVTAMRIIVKASMVARVMQELGLQTHHRGRDNVGEVVISGEIPQWTEDLAERLCRSVIALSELDVLDRVQVGVLSKEELRMILQEWEEADQHHSHDPAYRANFEGKSSNSRISARLMASQKAQSPRLSIAVGAEAPPATRERQKRRRRGEFDR
jgi:hypothetical protein